MSHLSLPTTTPTLRHGTARQIARDAYREWSGKTGIPMREDLVFRCACVHLRMCCCVVVFNLCRLSFCPPVRPPRLASPRLTCLCRLSFVLSCGPLPPSLPCVLPASLPACLSLSSPPSSSGLHPAKSPPPLPPRFIEWQARQRAPITPHWCEHLWSELLGRDGLVIDAAWPAPAAEDKAMTTAYAFLKARRF